MDRRLKLHELLCGILGSRNVYFQPPSNVKMQYDAIVYSRSNIENRHANNNVYKQNDVYELTAIYEDPDSDIVRKISLLPRCRFDRQYVSENLNHAVFTLYY